MALNVLVVDDSAVMRSMIIKTVKMSGLDLGDIHQAADGRQGLAALGANWIDLAILDINMPVMNGEDMIRSMRADPATRDIPVIVVSTEGSQTRIAQLKQMGAWFIQKPFTPEMIRDAITAMTGIGDGDA